MVEPLTPAEIQSINTALAGLPKGKLRYKRAQREHFFRLRGTDLSNEDIAALKEQFESDETGIDATSLSISLAIWLFLLAPYVDLRADAKPSANGCMVS